LYLLAAGQAYELSRKGKPASGITAGRIMSRLGLAAGMGYDFLSSFQFNQ
jgi:hypothetical protein